LPQAAHDSTARGDRRISKIGDSNGARRTDISDKAKGTDISKNKKKPSSKKKKNHKDGESQL
jgi:hypothetical protein